MHGAYRNVDGRIARIYSEGDLVTPRDVVTGNGVSEPSFGALLTSSSYIAKQRNTVQTTNSEREFNEDSLSAALSLQPSRDAPAFASNTSRPVRRISAPSSGQVLLQLGNEASGSFFGFSLYRNGNTGGLVFEGNQVGYNNYEFMGDIQVTNPAGAIILKDSNGNPHRITVNADKTLTIS
jgi:hypothetical protein